MFVQLLLSQFYYLLNLLFESVSITRYLLDVEAEKRLLPFCELLHILHSTVEQSFFEITCVRVFLNSIVNKAKLAWLELKVKLVSDVSSKFSYELVSIYLLSLTSLPNTAVVLFEPREQK